MTTMLVHQVAAKLWADKLRDGFSNDAGDTGLSKAITALAPSLKNVSNQQIDNFEKQLSEAIVQQLETEEEVFLTVDYEPKYLLADIFRQSQIEQLPIKSRMWVYKDKIIYIFGYNGERQEWHANQD